MQIRKIRKCQECKRDIDEDVLDKTLSICPFCGAYLRFHAYKRIESLADEDSFEEWDKEEKVYNPMNVDGYVEKIIKTQKMHNLNEGIVIGQVTIDNNKAAIGVMDTRFMMGSMGHVVGEKVAILFEIAAEKKLPVILFCCSGGARMQEGNISLMQMVKTSEAVQKHNLKRLFFISVLTNPTMGGVTASFATQADIVIAEKGAMIGFAGPRVIEQNMGVNVPEGFQSADFQMEHGFLDAIVEREQLKDYLSNILMIHSKKNPRRWKALFSKKRKCHVFADDMNPWEKIKIARSLERPSSISYINKIFDGFTQLAGDRVYGDDHAVIGGVAFFHNRPVTVVGQVKGKKSLQEAIFYNWGMPKPSGYKKTLRLIKQAEKFKRPVICFVDTIGADCGISAEEHGQGFVISELIKEMTSLKTPVLSIIVGEANSGGALAFCVGNEVWMLENAVYSILSPEGYASIIWKDNRRAPEAAEMMKFKASDLLKMGIVDKVVEEKQPVTVDSIDGVCKNMETMIEDFLNKYSFIRTKQIVEQRYQKFRKY